MPDNMRQGPATFALEADNAVQAAAIPAQLGAPNAQAAPIAPGITAGGPGVSDVNAKTFRAISDLASGALAPKIKEAAQQQFIGGVQRAMTGEALGEIIKDQPWYTDIFAPSSALAGARTYTSQHAVAQWAGKMQEQMPQLAKVGPEQLNAAATGALQGFMTGDAQADALITAHVVEQMAPLYKQHAKEHYVFMQKQASEAQITAWESSGKVLQGYMASAASGKGTVSPEDVEAAKTRFLASVVPFADQSDEAYERNVAAFMQGAASQGNFQVIKLFKDSGLYDKLDPAKRAALDSHIRAAGRQALDKVMPQFGMDVAMLTRDMTQDPRGVPAKVLALNKRAAAITGVTEAELIPLSSIDNIMGNILVAQDAAARAAAKDALKPDPLDGLARADAQLKLGPGHLDRCVLVGMCKETDAEAVGLNAWEQAKSPAERVQILNSRTAKAFDSVKTVFTNTLRSEEYQDGVGQMAQVYKGLTDDVKPHYFAEGDRQLMDRFNSLVQSGTPPAAAWVVARVSPAVNANLIPTEAKDAISKAIRAHAESANESWFINDVTPGALRTIEAMTMRSYKSDRANVTPDIAAKRAYSEARANGLEIIGHHAVVNMKQTDRPLRPMFSMIGEGTKATAEAFDSVMEEKAKAVDVKLDDNYEVFRLPDADGQANFYATATNKDGQVFNWRVTSAEVKAHVVAKVGAAVKRKTDAAANAAPMPPVITDGGAALGPFPKP